MAVPTSAALYAGALVPAQADRYPLLSESSSFERRWLLKVLLWRGAERRRISSGSERLQGTVPRDVVGAKTVMAEQASLSALRQEGGCVKRGVQL